MLILSTPVRATKAEGPFSVDVKITGTHAVVVIRTSIKANNVELQFSGGDGLEVQGAQPKGNVRIKTLNRASLAPGEVWTEQIDVTPGEGLSYLFVLVQTPGQPGVSRAFSFGQLSEKQKADRQRGTRLDPDGVPIRLMNE